MSEVVKIIEEKPIASKPIVPNGLTDVGLVGTIVAAQMISFLKMKEVAKVESELLPPVIVLQRVTLRSSRILWLRNPCGTNCRIAMPSFAASPLASSIVDWARLKEAKLLISLGGVAEPNRRNLEKPKEGS